MNTVWNWLFGESVSQPPPQSPSREERKRLRGIEKGMRRSELIQMYWMYGCQEIFNDDPIWNNNDDDDDDDERELPDELS